MGRRHAGDANSAMGTKVDKHPPRHEPTQDTWQESDVPQRYRLLSNIAESRSTPNSKGTIGSLIPKNRKTNHDRYKALVVPSASDQSRNEIST